MQGLDGLVVLPTDPDPLVNAIKEIKDKGTFVALVDRAPSNNDNTIRDLYVAGNNPALGQVAGEYIKATTPDAQVVVIRGLPIPIDQQRQDGFDKGIEGSNVKVLDRQYGNWNRDDAFRVMQDFLTKYPKIDVVWAQDDDMLVGVLEAIKQSNRSDIQYVVGGAGSKDMIKRVMDGDKLVPVDVLYPPAMVATAMDSPPVISMTRFRSVATISSTQRSSPRTMPKISISQILHSDHRSARLARGAPLFILEELR
ncbi:rhizopine-binding protein [Brucella vulpis]|nr:rhizopine-binding protein [Brucella vulpis]